MNITEYVAEKTLHFIPALYVVGVFLKNTPKMPDWIIPWVLTALGIAGGCAVIGLNTEGVLQGILAAGAAVLGNQLFKQTIYKN